MSKRLFSETADADINYSNKKPDRSSDQTEEKQSSNQSTNTSTTSQLTSQQTDQSPNQPPQGDKMDQPVALDDEHEDEDGIDSDESDWNDDEAEEIAFDNTKLSDYTIHFNDMDSECISLHMHRNTLVLMSKYFETLILEADDNKPSKCTRTAKCQEPGHRCLIWKGCQIGGLMISRRNIKDFFHSLYAAFDGSGRSKETFDRARKEGYLCHFVPDEEILRRVKAIDPIKRLATYDCWDYHSRYEVTCLYLWSTPVLPKLGTKWPSDQGEYDPEAYHLANYFQCDSLLKMYEATAVEVVNALENTECCDLIWLLLRCADKYKWSELRNLCLKAVAKDVTCRLRPDWKDIVESIDHATLIEAFALAVEHSAN